MQPLFEYGMDVGGIATRALELEGDGPGSCCCTAGATRPTPGGRCSAELGARGRRAIAVDLPGVRRRDRARARRDAAAARRLRGRAGRAVGRTPRSRRGRQLARRRDRAAARPSAADLPLRGRRPGRARRARHAALVRRSSSATRSCGGLLALGIPLPRAARALAAVGGDVPRLAFSRTAAAEAEAVARVRRPPREPRGASPPCWPAGGGCCRSSPPRRSTSPPSRCPVLLVWGTRDRMVPHRGARVLIEALPATRAGAARGLRPLPAARGAPSAPRAAARRFPEPALALAA